MRGFCRSRGVVRHASRRLLVDTPVTHGTRRPGSLPRADTRGASSSSSITCPYVDSVSCRVVPELARDVDHRAALVQQQRAERMPQRVRRRRRARRPRSPRGRTAPGCRPASSALALASARDLARPALVGVRRPRARRRGPGTPARPSSGVPCACRHASRSSRSGASSRTLRRCPVFVRVDQQRPLADVAPAQRERLLRPQPRVGQHRDQRRVARLARRPHRLDRRRRQRPHLALRRPARLAHQPHRVARDPLGLERPLQDRCRAPSAP